MPPICAHHSLRSNLATPVTVHFPERLTWQTYIVMFCLLLCPMLLIAQQPTPTAGSHSLVISQMYFGNNSTSTSAYPYSYVEIFNTSAQKVDLQNWMLVYSSSTQTNTTFGDSTRQWIGSIDPTSTYCLTGCTINYSAAFTASNCNASALPGEYTRHCWLNPGQYMLIKVKANSGTGSLGQTFPLLAGGQPDFDLDLNAQPDPAANVTINPSGQAGKYALIAGHSSPPTCDYSSTYGYPLAPAFSSPATITPRIVDLVGYAYTSTNCWETNTAKVAPTFLTTAGNYSNGWVDFMSSTLRNRAAFVRTSGFAGPHNSSATTAVGTFNVIEDPCADTDNNASDFGPVNVGTISVNSGGTGMENWVLHNSYNVFDVINGQRGYTPRACSNRSTTPPKVTVTGDVTSIPQAAANVATVNVTITVEPSTQPIATNIAISRTVTANGLLDGATFTSASSLTDGGWVNNKHVYTGVATVPTDNPGTYTIDVNATDDAYRTGTASLVITVTAGDKPVADNQTLSTAFNTPLDITLTASNSPTSFTAGTASNGTVACTGAICTYAPNAGFVGADSFTFTATNAGGTSDPATINITVNGPAKPVANPQSISVAVYSPANPITLTATNSPTGYAYGQPANGVVSGTPPNVTYTPNNGFEGSDSFTFTASNEGGTSDPATVSIDVIAPVAASLTAPTTGTVLSGKTATFTWTAGTLVTKYMLLVGTSVGATDDFYSGEVTSTTLDVTGLRSTDGNIYVRLYSWIPSLKGWRYEDKVFAAGGPSKATLTSPLVSISGTSATFNWTTGNEVTKYMLFVGTAPATADDYYSGEVTTTSVTVNGLRSTDGNIYVRLYSWYENGWHYNDYVLTHTPPVTPVAATLTAPVAISGTTAEFTWTAGTAIDHYMLCVGTQPGGTDNYYSGPTTSTDIVVDGMRTVDGNIYVRLYSWATDHWLWKDYVFTVQQ